MRSNRKAVTAILRSGARKRGLYVHVDAFIIPELYDAMLRQLQTDNTYSVSNLFVNHPL